MKKDIFSFLKCAPTLTEIPEGLIINLSQRYAIAPDTMALFLHAAINGVLILEN